MASILEQLYKGDLYPYSKFNTTVKDFKLHRDKAFHSYSEFHNKLPKELKEEFEALIDDHLDLLPYELQQNFIDGFCMGARIIIQVFTNPGDTDESQ